MECTSATTFARTPRNPDCRLNNAMSGLKEVILDIDGTLLRSNAARAMAFTEEAAPNRTQLNPVEIVQTETMDHHGTPIAKAQSVSRKEFEKCFP
jgi:hypothetical protein